MDKLDALKSQDPLRKVPAKSAGCVRYLTFNVNGINTLFKHHPWNQLHTSVDAFLASLEADIVSLQELKVQLDKVALIGMTRRYKAFISVPKSKKGYSGVALYVRVPTPGDSPQVVRSLTILRAEEGISGRLKASNGKCYYELQDSIGGYPSDEELQHMDIDFKTAQDLDSEGRCAVVELANNTVVFSLYCPANSSGTPEGQLFRLRFLELLFQRTAKLKQSGKNVVVMGDINVSPDLIDNAEAINEGIKTKVLTNNLKDGGFAFEKLHETACLAFRTSARHRALLNLYVLPTLHSADKVPSQYLHDSTRIFQKRRLAMYTVWNTLTGARQSNFGSRIDLILISCEKAVANIDRADILPYLHGSDHCPVFTDINTSYDVEDSVTQPAKLDFEARNFYKLVAHRDITSMFGSVQRRTPETESSKSPSPTKLNGRSSEERDKSGEPESKKPKYVSRKATGTPQQKINNFFFNANPKKVEEKEITPAETPAPSQLAADTIKLNSVSALSTLMYEKPPKCYHKEACIMRTSLTKDSKGKRFWCCARAAKGSSTELGEHRCNFFEWAKKA